MANKRMFSNSVILTDDFLRLPHSAISLYFLLNVTADDEGFNAAPEDVMKRTRTTSEDYRLLAERGFIIPLDSGVIVIRHWFIHNYSSSSRTRAQISYMQEKKQVTFDDNGVYELIEIGNNEALSLYEMMQLNNGKPLSYSQIKSFQKGEKTSVQPQLDNFGVGTLAGKDKERERGEEVKRIREREESGIPYSRNHLYGSKGNVLLSDDELEDIYDKYQRPDDLINKIGYIFLNSKKRYSSHYAFLMKVAMEDNWPKRTAAEKQLEQKKEKERKEEEKQRREEERKIREIMAKENMNEDEAKGILEEEIAGEISLYMSELRKKFQGE